MRCFRFPDKLVFGLILIFQMGLCVVQGTAAERETWPSGFGAAVTAAERALSGKPEPDGYFREMMGYWHGAPGLEALRRRWEGFAASGVGARAEADGKLSPENGPGKGGGAAGAVEGKEGRAVGVIEGKAAAGDKATEDVEGREKAVAEKERAGFAVLAALVLEAEGRPEEALTRLRNLKGGDARWNEGRLLALLGWEEEAVAVLAPLVVSAERAETGAAALIAVTERDCLRGDFAGALKRTEAAWEARPEEDFRLRILERHLSLLVEAGRERDFVENQVALADLASAGPEEAGKPASGDNLKAGAGSAEEASRNNLKAVEASGPEKVKDTSAAEAGNAGTEAGIGKPVAAASGKSAGAVLPKTESGAVLTARKVLAVMADWFTADSRLRAAREKLAAEYATGVLRDPGMTARHLRWIQPRPTLDCGLLWPGGAQMERLGENVESSAKVAAGLAAKFSTAGEWPENLEGEPLLKRVFADRPLYLGRSLFPNADPARPLPPLAGRLVETLSAGVEREVLNLIERAWAGKAGPEDAEVLVSVIAEAPELRKVWAVGLPPEERSRQGGWPTLPAFPTEQVVWNLSGETWAAFYRNACRLAPLRNQQNAGFYAEPGGVSGWAQWRPEWPEERDSALMVWAWRQLTLLGQATPQRAAAVAARMPDVSDRFLFAARCLRRELLVEWCRDDMLLRQVSSAGLMQSVIALRREDSRPVLEGEPEAALAIGREMARRLELNEWDLIRSLRDFRQHATAGMKRDFENHPVNADLVEAMGLFLDWNDGALRELWNQRQTRTIPHPLYGLPVCPSVERFRVLSMLLAQQTDDGGGRRFGPVTPLQRVVQELLGGDMFYEPAGRAKPLLRALEEFATANPLKHQLLRWEALTKEHKIVAEVRVIESRPFHQRGGLRQDMNLRKAVRALAEEEPVSLSWYLVRAALEEDPAKQAVLLELLRARSPLSAGAMIPAAAAAASVRDSPDFKRGPAVDGHGGPGANPNRTLSQESQPEDLAAMFLKMLADPVVRQRLEPAGVLSVMMRQGDSRDAFLLGLRRAPAIWEGLAERLIKEHDPLAARMAVTLMAGRGQPGVSAEWIGKGLKAFPEDAELLLASAALEAQRGNAESSEAARSAFLKGLGNLGPLMSFDRDTYAVWCGIDAGMPWGGLDTARALAAFVERAQPASIPQNWVQVMEGTLRDTAELRQLTEAEARAMVMAVIRLKARWRPGDGSPQGWMPLLDSLTQAERPGLAAEAAEVLLCEPSGSLGYPGEPGEPAPPWNNGSGSEATGPNAEGWQWLQLAERGDPAGLADRLKAVAVAATHPGDEQTAFAALLARGRTRALTEEDLKELLAGLSPAGRHRALAYASWLLPPDRLPEALVLDSWEAEAVVEFSDVGNGSRNFQQGNDYLDRLEQAGASEAVGRVLPALVESVRTLGGYPPDFPGCVFRRLERFHRPDLAKELQAILLELLKKPAQQYGLQHNQILTAVLVSQTGESAPAELPAELVRQVAAALEGSGTKPALRQESQPEDPAQEGEVRDQDQNPEPAPSPQQRREEELQRKRDRYQDYTLLQLAWTAAGDARWHGVLRQLLADRPAELEDRGNTDGTPSWQALALVLEATNSGRVIPDPQLAFSSGSPGLGRLQWSFRGLMSPPLTERERMSGWSKIPLPWPTLAASLAGKFDALVLVTDDDPKGGERLAARIEKLPASGEISLENLPPSGHLRLMLIRREAPQITAETESLACSTLPVLLDTAKPPGPQTAHPAGWRLLCEPCPLGGTDQWQVINAGAEGDWPEDVALLMLDEAGQVCAMADLTNAGQRRNGGIPGGMSVRISRHHFNAEPVLSDSPAPLRVTGPPCQLALGRSVKPSVFQLRNSSSRTLQPQLTVRKYSSQAAETGNVREPAVAGRMEIIRTWHLPSAPQREGYPMRDNPSILRSPLRAVWYADGGLNFIDLEKAEPASRRVKLNLPPGALLSGMQWTGPRIHLLFHLRPADGAGSGESVLYSFDPATETPPEKPHHFGKSVELQSLESLGISDAPGISDDGGLHGIINSEGRLLTLPTAPPPPDAAGRRTVGNPQYAISPTRLGLYTEQAGEFPVADWSDGTLRLLKTPTREPALARQPKPSGVANLQAQDRFLVEYSSEAPVAWLSPLSFPNGVEAVDADHFIGVVSSDSGSTRDIVLLRKVPSKP